MEQLSPILFTALTDNNVHTFSRSGRHSPNLQLSLLLRRGSLWEGFNQRLDSTQVLSFNWRFRRSTVYARGGRTGRETNCWNVILIESGIVPYPLIRCNYRRERAFRVSQEKKAAYLTLTLP